MMIYIINKLNIMITIITLIAICSVIFNIYLVKKLRKRDGEIAQGEKAFKELLGTHKASLKNNDGEKIMNETK